MSERRTLKPYTRELHSEIEAKALEVLGRELGEAGWGFHIVAFDKDGLASWGMGDCSIAVRALRQAASALEAGDFAEEALLQ